MTTYIVQGNGNGPPNPNPGNGNGNPCGNGNNGRPCNPTVPIDDSIGIGLLVAFIIIVAFHVHRKYDIIK